MSVKQIITVLCIGCMITPALSAKSKKSKEAEPEGYKFTTVIENPITSIKDQASSGTCWCFSALSFFESEILKNGYTDSLDLSEMFIVHNSYQEKGEKFVRLHGVLNFGQGSSFGNVLYGLKHYGIVPEWEMKGLNYGTDEHRHNELDGVLRAYLDVIVKNPNGTLSTAWKEGFKGILDAYLGECPETFTVNGKEYNPHTYMESLGIMNVPLDDLIAIIDNALENGYTVAWASDVSERGFTRDGLGIVPDYDKMEVELKETGTDQARWIGSSKNDLYKKAFEAPCPELEITQEMRQEGYDNYQTTDDHGMQIFGAGKYDGIWYVSEAFVRYKTMDVLVNKNAIPEEIRAKMNL